jgi:hypothetical protein
VPNTQQTKQNKIEKKKKKKTTTTMAGQRLGRRGAKEAGHKRGKWRKRRG